MKSTAQKYPRTVFNEQLPPPTGFAGKTSSRMTNTVKNNLHRKILANCVTLEHLLCGVLLLFLMTCYSPVFMYTHPQ